MIVKSMNMINPSTKVIALIGNPVRHSLSPKIQNYLIRKYEKDSVYVVFEFPQENLKEAFYGAKKLGFVGLNITMPYKERVFRMVDKTDLASDTIKSVNTVKFDKREGTSIGFNTDIGGFIKSLDDKNFPWSGSKCLVIGGGGSAKSTIYGILKKRVKDIYVYNRTIEKVKKIIKNFKDIGGERIKILSDISDIDEAIDKISLIVNCTPLGMDMGSYKDLMPIPAGWNLKKKYIFDMVYNPRETRLIRKAKKEGSVIINGMDMLINQAVFSFKVWFGIMPGINVIKEIYNLV